MQTDEQVTQTSTGYQRLLVILIAIAALGATLMIILQILRPEPDRVGGVSNDPLIFPAPTFELTDQTGQTFSSAALEGKVYLVNFIFTRCPGPCLALTREMKLLHAELKQHPKWNDIRLITITVDPNHDKPDVLRSYIESQKVNDQHWHFLTGTGPEVRRVIGDGFKQTIQDDSDEPNHIIGHSQKIMIVDRKGMVRGWFEGIDGYQGEHELKNERADLKAKLKEVLDE